MLFIKNGMHMLAIKEGSVINVHPNPKFTKDGVELGAIMVNDIPVGIYPLEATPNFAHTVYDVFMNICKQINHGDTVVTIPFSYRFGTVEEYEEFKATLTSYDKNELFDIYYDGLSKVH